VSDFGWIPSRSSTHSGPHGGRQLFLHEFRDHSSPTASRLDLSYLVQPQRQSSPNGFHSGLITRSPCPERGLVPSMTLRHSSKCPVIGVKSAYIKTFLPLVLTAHVFIGFLEFTYFLRLVSFCNFCVRGCVYIWNIIFPRVHRSSRFSGRTVYVP